MTEININVSDQKCRQEPLFIGYQGENEVTRVIVDYSAWTAEFGEGTLSLELMRAGDTAPYLATLTVEEGKAVWTVTNVDTGARGEGAAGFVYTVDEQVKKSAVFRFFVGRDVGGTPGDRPDPYESLITYLERLAAQTEGNASAAAESASAAAGSATTATQQAQAAATARTAAETAQQAAETAQGAAETAQTAAEAARDAAVSSATDAAGSATTATQQAQAAATARAAAEAAQQAAETAQTAAETAQTAAEAARDAAASSATDAAGSATTATQQAQAAATARAAAEAAQQAAETAQQAAETAQTAAEAARDAAAASVINAAGSATTATQQAQAAATARTAAEAAQQAAETAQQAAETAQTAAEAARDAAAASATNAAGSATTATQQAQAAATARSAAEAAQGAAEAAQTAAEAARDAAAASAINAAGSATTATQQAQAAATARTAAEAAQQAAETAQTAAETAQTATEAARDAAASSATAAAGSATTATQQAQAAATARTAAETAQQAAETAQEAAETAQTAAEAARDAAAASATAAAGSATTAAQQAQAAATARTAAEAAQQAIEDLTVSAEEIDTAQPTVEKQVDPQTGAVNLNFGFAKNQATTATTVGPAPIVTFDASAADMPLKGLTVNIEPVQAGTGDPSPDNVRPISGCTGCNVTIASEFEYRLTNSTMTDSGLTITTSDDNYLSMVGTSTSNAGISLVTFVSTDTRLVISDVVAVEGAAPWFLWDATSRVNISGMKNDLNGQYTLTIGHSYSVGYIPNSGRTYSLKTRISLTHQHPTVYHITFPTEAGTVYGGTLDVVNRKLIVNKAIIYLADYTWSRGNSGSRMRYTSATISQLVGPKYYGSICNTFTLGTGIGNTTGNNTYWWTHEGLFRVFSEDFSTLSDFTNFLSQNNAHVVYNLADPIEIPLTDIPEITTLLVGTNNIWADCGDVTVTYGAYLETVKAHADRLGDSILSAIAPLEVSYTASRTYAVGSYLFVGTKFYKVTQAIAEGGTITPGTNAVQTTVAEQLIALAAG